MQRLLARAALRFYARHPWQLALAIAGISLGVAVYVGVDLANDSARRAFDLSTAVARGRTTHRLLPVGSPIPEHVYADLVRGRRVSAAAPVIESFVAVGTPNGARYALLGIDPVEEIAFRDYSRFVPGDDASFETLIATPATALLPESALVGSGAQVGARVTLFAGGEPHSVEIVGTVAAVAGDVEADAPVVTDIGTAQELLGRLGSLDRIDLVLTPAQAADLSAAPPPGTSLVVAGTETLALTEMTRAFRTNLTALGLLALVVGMFLVYATISFAVVQRRAMIGLLRSLGAEKRKVLATFLLEALGIGLVGTGIGLVLGHVLARGLIGLVLQTIGDLSFAATLNATQPSSWIYVRGAALGLGATLLSAFVPALEAARTQPDIALSRARLERAVRSRSRAAAWIAVPLLGAASVLLFLDERSLFGAFFALFLVLCAGASVVPAATIALTRAAAPAARHYGGLPLLLAVRGVAASLSRTGVAAAALAVAVATVIGVSVMISSFRASLVTWLDTTLTADAYLAADPAAENEPFGAARLAALADLPEVRGLGLSRTVRLPTRFGELPLRAATPGPDGWGLDFVAGAAQQAEAKLASSPSVVVAEPLAARFALAPGAWLELPTASGSAEFEIAGIFRDYSTAGSALVMGLDTYRQYWGDERITGVGVHFARGVTSAQGMAALRAALPDDPAIRVRSTESIERLSLAVFDRTFKITDVLRLLAGFVAFLGVLNAALAIQLERARELAILRTIGFSRRDLTTLILTQTGFLGAAAGVAAVPLGAVLAALLVYVINRRSFGWTMELVVTAPPFLLGVALAVAAALLAGVYPALRGARTNLDAALRDE
jgi:putative ABC transport system permease protein